VLKELDTIQDDAELFVLRAQYAYVKQDISNCRQMLEQALKLDPENKEALQLTKKIDS
jgi:hypothetical protein